LRPLIIFLIATAKTGRLVMIVWKSGMRYFIILFFLSMCLLIACSKSEEEQFSIGLSLVDKDPQRAVEELSKSFYPEDPDLPSYWFAQVMNQGRYDARGRAYLTLGQIENAEADFARLWPENLGDMRFRLEDYEAAIASYSEHINNPLGGDSLNAISSYISRGNSYMKTGDYHNAIADLDHALDITLKWLDLEIIVSCPDLDIMDRPLGEHYCGTESQIEEYKSSQGWVNTTTAIKAYKSRAEIFMATSKYLQATSDYESATSYDDSSHGSLMLFAWLGLGNAHRASGDTRNAAIAYTKVIEDVTSWPNFYGEEVANIYRLNPSTSGLADAWKFRGEIYIEEGYQKLGEKDLWIACMYGVRYTGTSLAPGGGLLFDGCAP